MAQKLIWTNHSITRLKERKMSKRMVVQAITNPQKTYRNNDATVEYQRRVGNKIIVAIAKKNEKRQMVIVSCWTNPPNPGTKDFKKRVRYYQMKHASLLKKIWLQWLSLVGC